MHVPFLHSNQDTTRTWKRHQQLLAELKITQSVKIPADLRFFPGRGGVEVRREARDTVGGGSPDVGLVRGERG